MSFDEFFSFLVQIAFFFLSVFWLRLQLCSLHILDCTLVIILNKLFHIRTRKEQCFYVRFITATCVLIRNTFAKLRGLQLIVKAWVCELTKSLTFLLFSLFTRACFILVKSSLCQTTICNFWASIPVAKSLCAGRWNMVSKLCL